MDKNTWINITYLVANLLLTIVISGTAGVPPPEMPQEMPPERSQLPVQLPEPKTPPGVVQPVARLAEPASRTAVPPRRRPLTTANVYRRMPTANSVVALTIDDGPGARTRELLAILEEKKVPATFFLLGKQAAANPGLARAIVAAGHDVANHSWSHPRLTELSARAVEREIARCTDVLLDLGINVRPFFRPPYGSRDEQVDEISRELGYHILLWDVDSRDWEFDDEEIVLERALKGLKPGSIVLFHDNPEVTLRVLPRFIDEVRSWGYEFVLLSDYIR
ncbi:MAG: polysaccharide deacetylase family protein [Firmicutes bacterium]|nr:polysaccharide deacetylase family protein [Bacillota bacterium]